MKRVLIITYYWPPSGGSGVQRWVKFAKYLPAEGWQPVIYTPENPELSAVDESLLADIPPEAEVLRRHITEPYSLYRRLLGRHAGAEKVTPIASGEKNWKQRLSLWIRGNLFVPDPRRSWVRPSVRYLKRYLREHPVDVMVTTGPPHSLHLIGERLHRSLGLPWVADFRDPWSEMYYLKHLGMTPRTWRRIREMEQRVLDTCQTVLTVTPQVQEAFRQRTKTEIAMITNGYDETDFAGLPTAPQDHFTLTHTGLLAQDGNPLTLWKVLGEKVAADPAFAESLQIRLIGKVDAAVLSAMDAAGLERQRCLLGYLDHPAAVQEQVSASLLLLPLRNDPQYKPILPGKVFEYLAARRPVLGIGQTDGAMAGLLRSCAAGQTFDWEDAAGMRRQIDAAWETFRTGGIPRTRGPIQSYSRRSLTHELARLLSSLIPPVPNAPTQEESI